MRLKLDGSRTGRLERSSWAMGGAPVVVCVEGGALTSLAMKGVQKVGGACGVALRRPGFTASLPESVDVYG